ncbi:serine acetyltransferase [Serratia fonticola]|uniref:serine O-acetyltransferase n=1 Tax=Serratia fonticola TaxID=47917 RepID=UPI0015C613A4|nr:serine O-acetyltransferase [Serratia fonticola]MBC3380913.1 serine acetyltransferase [Serratia fonticola]NYA40112.1 serine acetyltransferase [Serratia fonticola]
MSLKYKVYTDFYRATGKKITLPHFIYELVFNSNIGFKYIVWYRLANSLHLKRKGISSRILFKCVNMKLNRMKIKYGIEIPYDASIGEGLVIPHAGGIVLHPNSTIGKNCTILQGVTIGNNLFKSRTEVASIGDNVTIAAGAKIVGPLHIGNNVTIGANAVVTSDINSDCIVGGIPAKVISKKESITLNMDYLSEKDFYSC